MKKMRSLIFFWILLLIGATPVFIGCEESSYDVKMLAYDAESDSLVYKVNTISTLTDLNKLEGRATTIIGGLAIELDYKTQEVRWNEVGDSVAFNAFKSDGVYYPEDYTSLAMVSIYYGIEQAMLYFESVGMDTGILGDLETYYFADVLTIDETGMEDTEDTTNNAFYMPIDENDRGFYILPFTYSQGIPLSMNPGVLTHEYTHAVFQELVMDHLPLAPNGEYNISFSAYNYLWGVNEGLADVFAVALTGDPDFIRPSISNVEITRNATDVIEYRAVYDRNAENTNVADFNPYVIGAWLSATLFEVGRRIENMEPDSFGVPNEGTRRLVAHAAYNAMFNVGSMVASNFVPSDLINEFIAQFAAGPKNIACEVLSERYAIHYAEVEGCP